MALINQTNRRLLACLPLLGMALISISWHEPFAHGASLLSEFFQEQPAGADTVPPKGLDNHIREIRRAKEKLRTDMEGKNWDRIEAEMESALDRINIDKIDIDLQQSLSGLDRQMEQLEKQHLAEQFKFDNLEKQLKNAELQLQREFRNFNLDDKLEAARNAMVQARDNMSRIDRDDLKADMEQLRRQLKEQWKSQSADIAAQGRNARRQLADQRVHLRKSLDDAAKSLDRAEKQMEGYKTMIAELTAAGLIKDADNYEIECRKGVLYIDGKEQSAAISKKYSKYFPEENTRIINRKGNWNSRSGTITD